jgi:MoxR-like ATPase
LDRAARAHAFLQQKDYVSPENIHAVFFDILRHRILLTFEAEAEGMTAYEVLREILKGVAIP